MADKAGGDECAVVAALFGLLGGQIPLRAARELDEEGLLGIRACLDLVAVVEEELESGFVAKRWCRGAGWALGVENVHLPCSSSRRRIPRSTCSAAASLKSTSPGFSAR